MAVQQGASKAEKSAPARRKRTRPAEVVRRRMPGYKLVNGGWRRDPGKD